jgi:hypothetical protein
MSESLPLRHIFLNQAVAFHIACDGLLNFDCIVPLQMSSGILATGWVAGVDNDLVVGAQPFDLVS